MHQRYQLIRSLSRGGMGMLYLASEMIARHERQVVIKEMLDYYDPADPQGATRALGRFEAEAATLASLSLSGVPQIFDFFSEGGRNYIVMQYIEGENLESRLTHADEHGRLVPGAAYPVEQARRWGVRICRILESLAMRNIVHLDIKPANLILDHSGDIWLVDFGTARARYASVAAPAGPGSAPSAKAPSVYGTPGYAPPEQFSGNPEPRSDVYALAAALYHLMTDDDPADSQPLFARLNLLPPDVAQALRLALEPDVAQRVSAAEFGRLLDVHPQAAVPFHWRDGTPTYRPEDLGVTAERHWDEALGYFTGGAWQRWFQALHRNDLDERLQAALAGDQDAHMALDAFLRLLDPSLTPAILQVDPPTVNIGILPWGERRSVALTLHNHGGGMLRAHVEPPAPGLRASVSVVRLRRNEILQVSIDARSLSPAKGRQSLPLALDAGPAGRAQVVFQVVVPEPHVRPAHTELDLGTVSRAEVATVQVALHNQGGSPTEALCESADEWLEVRPGSLYLPPGRPQMLEVTIDAARLPYGVHESAVLVRAYAGRWEQEFSMPVKLNVSLLKTAVQTLRQPFLWMAAMAVYGGVLGWLLGRVGQVFQTQVSGSGAMAVVAALFGAAIYAAMAGLLAAFGLVEGANGASGVRRAALLGAFPGLAAGALAGLLLYRLWLAFSPMQPGMGLGLFGGFTGLLTGAFLGAALFFLSKD